MKKVFGCLILGCCLGAVAVSGCNSNSISLTKDGIIYEKVNVTSGDTTTEGYYVYGCNDNIEVLNIPAEVNGLPVLGLSREAFANNLKLKEVTLPDTITRISLQSKPFAGCNNIEKITLATSDVMLLFTDYGGGTGENKNIIPESLHYIYLTSGCTSIDYRDFHYCTNIREIHIPKSVTVIEDGTNRTSIGVNGHPASSDNFEDLPFAGCTSLSIYCEATSKPNGWGTYWNYIDSSTAAKVYWNNY